jgi:hypothetical protein
LDSKFLFHSGKGIDYHNSWISIRRYYEGNTYTFLECSFICDFGTPEDKFVRIEQLRRLLCWFHILDILNDAIDLHVGSDNKILKILTRFIYASKTKNHLRDCLTKLVEILDKRDVLKGEIGYYYTDAHLLYSWISIDIESIYKEYSNNYIELSFRGFNEKTGRKTTRVGDIVKYFDRHVTNLRLDIRNNEKTKKYVINKWNQKTRRKDED